MILILLLVTTLIVSLSVGFLARLQARELAFQTTVMFAAALGFYGLTILL